MVLFDYCDHCSSELDDATFRCTADGHFAVCPNCGELSPVLIEPDWSDLVPDDDCEPSTDPRDLYGDLLAVPVTDLPLDYHHRNIVFNAVVRDRDIPL